MRAAQESVQQTLAGLARKRAALTAEQQRRGQLLECAQRLFLDTEIQQATAKYREAISSAKTHFQSLTALSRLNQRGVTVETWEPTRFDVGSALRAERERFARLGLAI